MSTQEFNAKLLETEKSLKYFALSLSKDSENAKDLVQETFLKAIKNRNKYISDTNMKAWLFTILRNTYINQVTKLSSKNTINDDSENNYLIKNKKNNNESTESKIYKSELDDAVSMLSDEYRIPFTKFYDGYKYKEIAEETNLPIGTVKSRIFFFFFLLIKSLKTLS